VRLRDTGNTGGTVYFPAGNVPAGVLFCGKISGKPYCVSATAVIDSIEGSHGFPFFPLFFAVSEKAQPHPAALPGPAQVYQHLTIFIPFPADAPQEEYGRANAYNIYPYYNCRVSN
jgi:hypothetical protein